MDRSHDLVVRCIPVLRRYARALTRDRDRADDLVQDTLERAWTRLHLWRGGVDPKPWLFSILHSIHISGERRRGRAPVLVPLDLVDGPEAGASAAGAVAGPDGTEARIDLRRVIGAFDTLPDGQREVLLLVAVEGFSYHEVAEILMIPIGTVMSRLSRARERLRTALEPTVRAERTKDGA